MHAMNLFTRVGWEVRAALQKSQTVPAALLHDTAEELADYLLFVNEWPLESPVEGNSGFTKEFAAEGPRDSKGRSLREFDLQHRLMRYPCSYMIYSPAFDALPVEARDAIYQRLWQILSVRNIAQDMLRFRLPIAGILSKSSAIRRRVYLSIFILLFTNLLRREIYLTLS